MLYHSVNAVGFSACLLLLVFMCKTIFHIAPSFAKTNKPASAPVFSLAATMHPLTMRWGWALRSTSLLPKVPTWSSKLQTGLFGKQKCACHLKSFGRMRCLPLKICCGIEDIQHPASIYFGLLKENTSKPQIWVSAMCGLWQRVSKSWGAGKSFIHASLIILISNIKHYSEGGVIIMLVFRARRLHM